MIVKSDPLGLLIHVAAESLDEEAWGRLRRLIGGRQRAPAADALILHLRSLGAQCMVTEHPYTDRDYSADFVGFYASVFKTYPRDTSRIHFFRRDIRPVLELPLRDRLAALEGETSYLGFVVIRPISQGPIGRTVLPFPHLSDGLIVRGTVRAVSGAHLQGARLQVQGAPFIQQEQRIGACAQAAIWMADRPLHQRYGRSAWHAMTDITRLATNPIDDTLSQALPHGSSGLNPLHITRALRAMGHQPHSQFFLVEPVDLDQARPRSPAESENSDPAEAETARESPLPTVVRYLDSGLPVILGLTAPNSEQLANHAVTAIGYVEVIGAGIRAGDGYECFVRGIVVHDDQGGPYRIMPLTSADEEHMPADRVLVHEGRVATVEDLVTHIFVPLSPRVLLTADHVHIVAWDFVEQYVRLLLTHRGLICFERAVVAFARQWQEGAIIRRAYLTTAGRYRHHIASSAMPEEAKVRAVNRKLPHFIWVVELIERDTAVTAESARPIIGHLVFNATSSTDPTSDLLFAHLPHQVVERDPDGSDGKGHEYQETLIPIAEHCPYAQRVRG